MDKGRKYNVQDKPTAQEIVEIMTGAEVVIAVYPDGGRTILSGRDILEEVVASGEPERLKVATIPVATTTEAEVIAAALSLVQKNKMGKGQVATFQRMLDHVQALN
jgi:hypothetical protein